MSMRTGPDYIQFYPTLRCNRTCHFCFNRSLSPLPDMSHRDFIRMLDVFQRSTVRTLDIMGGEPTLHTDIVSMVREAIRAGLSVNISSNGSRLDVLAELVLLPGDVTIGISVNDRVTLLRVKGFVETYQPVVKTVLCRDTDPALIREILACQPGKYHLIFRDALEQSESDAAMPYHQFLSTVRQNFDPGTVGTVSCSGFLPDTEHYPELAHVRCPAGTTKLGILPDGSVYPCNLFFGNGSFQLGNILSDPFDRIWNSSALDFFRDNRRDQCLDSLCELRGSCHGGCPAHRYARTGALHGPDPRCMPVDSR